VGYSELVKHRGPLRLSLIVDRSDGFRVFFAYRDSPERRSALAQPVGHVERYRLFGLDEIVGQGAVVRHNLERPAPPAWARGAARAVNRPLYGVGGYGGDFASLLPSLRVANEVDVLFSTVDTVGIPLILLNRARLVRRPVVYAAVGLPERLDQLRGGRVERQYRAALRGTHTIVAYAQSEVDRILEWLGPGGPDVRFVPFGVDVESFRPEPERGPEFDVVSIGADPRRDFALLRAVAERRPDLSFRIVASRDNARALGTLPPNMSVETDIPLTDVRDRLAATRVVALPVRDNSYSGATTVLLQAMAMAKPVVVSRTAAIARGYELEDSVNCRLVEPGDVDAFEHAIVETTTGADAARSLGTRARQTVERGFSWERYTSTLWEILRAATSPPSA
jgi:glycosyltransferase involved in cell wall biosynthesis